MLNCPSDEGKIQWFTFICRTIAEPILANSTSIDTTISFYYDEPWYVIYDNAFWVIKPFLYLHKYDWLLKKKKCVGHK